MLRGCAHRPWAALCASCATSTSRGPIPKGRSGQSTPQATHLIKVAAQAALGQRPHLDVFGTDYATPDGTCIRDYVQVTDVARAHLAALRASSRGRRERDHELRLRPWRLGAGGRGGGEESLGRRFRGSSRSPPEPAIRQASWRESTGMRGLGWAPLYDDLEEIVAQALRWEQGSGGAKSRIEGPFQPVINLPNVAMAGRRSLPPGSDIHERACSKRPPPRPGGIRVLGPLPFSVGGPSGPRTGRSAGGIPAFRRRISGPPPKRGASPGQPSTNAFRGVEPDAKIVALTRKQSEFVRPIWDYINGAISDGPSHPWPQDGGRMVARLSQRSSRPMAFPSEVVLGVWGMETNFGGFTGSIYVVRALSTLAYTGYRAEFFKEELLTALQILEPDHIDRDKMLGSWAGAMGQTQFMPIELPEIRGRRQPRRRAGHLDVGAGRACIDGELSAQERLEARPSLGLRSGAAGGLRFPPRSPGLRQMGGARRQTAGRQSRSPFGRSVALFPRRRARTGVSGHRQLRRDQELQFVGCLCAWAWHILAIGSRGTGYRRAWPKNEPMLDKDQREELQKHLAGLGLYTGDPDGKLGSKTRDALRNFQVDGV